MNRRDLFRGVIGVVGAAMLPAVVLAEVTKPVVGASKFSEVSKLYEYIRLTPDQLDRVANLYGVHKILIHFAGKKLDNNLPYGYEEGGFKVGYSNLIGWVQSVGDPSVYLPVHRPVEDRPDHMFLARQMFHGKSWEEAIVYAETYKKWLEYYSSHQDGKWLQRAAKDNPVLAKYWYDNEVEMQGSVNDLQFRKYSL